MEAIAHLVLFSLALVSARRVAVAVCFLFMFLLFHDVLAFVSLRLVNVFGC